VNPDYYDDPEKHKWYEELEKRQLFDDYFHDDHGGPDFSNRYLERIRKNIYNLPEKLPKAAATVGLKMGQLIRFREGYGAILKDSMGIVIDKVPGEVQVMTSDDQLVWAVEYVVEAINESR
jgi:hypothetical protein|tara:strand:+ start:832 stop:1194 length:363 start_codon:yes stop_codon:yes gene_type:complete